MKGMTDAEVSRASNVPKATLSNWKNGRAVPKAAALWRISRVVDCPVDWLIEKE